MWLHIALKVAPSEINANACYLAHLSVICQYEIRDLKGARPYRCRAVSFLLCGAGPIGSRAIFFHADRARH